MNFFKLYIGDYQRDTAHLSVTEHGAFLLMLQHYYATEKPLPLGKALHRMLRAQDKAEREAIDSVAEQFWRQTDAGLVNDRADAEITKAGAQAETNRAIAQAREDKRKAARKQHEGSTNRADDQSANGSESPEKVARKSEKTGSQPTAAETAGGAQVVDSYGAGANGAYTNRATNDQPNHSHSQTPDTNTKEQAHAGAVQVAARPEDQPETPGRSPTPAGLVCRAMKAAGMAAVNPGDPRLMALIDQGATLAEFEGLAAEAVEKRKGFAWVLAVLAARREEAQALRLAPSAEDSTPWHQGGRKAIEAKAAEHGIGPWDEVQEQWHQYRARVFKAAGHTPERTAA